MQRGGAFIADASKPPRTTWTPRTIQATDDVDAADDTGGAASEDDVDAADDTGHGRTGSCNIYSTADGTSVPLSQAEHYAYRDTALDHMNFDEFVMSIRITKKPTEQHSSHDGPGRPRNPCYALLDPHPLKECHHLQQKSKFDVPVLVGTPPPRLPTKLADGATTTPARQRQTQEHAAYFCALFVPWSARRPINTTPAAWQAFLQELEEAAATSPSANDNKIKSIAQGRLFRIEQVSKALTMNTKKAQLMTTWRNRNRTLWETLDQDPSSTSSGAGIRKSHDADKEIDDLRQNAARRCDPAILRRATNRETWAQENFATLDKLLTLEKRLQTWPAGAPTWDGPPTLPLPDGYAGLQRLLRFPRAFLRVDFRVKGLQDHGLGIWAQRCETFRASEGFKDLKTRIPPQFLPISFGRRRGVRTPAA